MSKLYGALIFAAMLSFSSAASAQFVFSFREYKSFLDVPDGIFWNDVSGALAFCDHDELRASFHHRLAQKKYGKLWAQLSKAQQADLNQFIMFGTGVGRGLELSRTSSSNKQEICSSVLVAAKAYIAAEA